MRLDSRERYHYDAAFRTLVDVMVMHIHNLDYTPTEMREAAMLAACIHEERTIRPRFFIPEDRS